MLVNVTITPVSSADPDRPFQATYLCFCSFKQLHHHPFTEWLTVNDLTPLTQTADDHCLDLCVTLRWITLESVYFTGKMICKMFYLKTLFMSTDTSVHVESLCVALRWITLESVYFTRKMMLKMLSENCTHVNRHHCWCWIAEVEQRGVWNSDIRQEVLQEKGWQVRPLVQWQLFSLSTHLPAWIYVHLVVCRWAAALLRHSWLLWQLPVDSSMPAWLSTPVSASLALGQQDQPLRNAQVGLPLTSHNLITLFSSRSGKEWS